MQLLHRTFSGNYFVGFLRKWQESDIAGHSAPIGGLSYYISPPRELFDLQRDPSTLYSTSSLLWEAVLSCPVSGSTSVARPLVMLSPS